MNIVIEPAYESEERDGSMTGVLITTEGHDSFYISNKEFKDALQATKDNKAFIKAFSSKTRVLSSSVVELPPQIG